MHWLEQTKKVQKRTYIMNSVKHKNRLNRAFLQFIDELLDKHRERQVLPAELCRQFTLLIEGIHDIIPIKDNTAVVKLIVIEVN